MQLIKNVAQVYLAIFLVLQWANNVYYLTQKHLVKRQGILHAQEDVYDFDNIRSLSINQSLMGKILNYGDITLKTSASEGYQGDIVLAGISSPNKYEQILKECF